MFTDVVGRDAELEAIDRWLDAPRPAAFLIEGEAGIGKTTLWRAGVRAGESRGLHALSCSPSAVERELGFAALGDLLAELDALLVESLPPLQRRALEGALLLRDADRPPEGRALGLGLLEVIRRLSSQMPLLLAIDDVQWLDPPSEAALAFALRRLEDENVALLVARRTGEDGGGARLGLSLEPGRGEPRRCELQPLRLGALGQLVLHRLGLRLRRPELLRLEALSGGNPFFALELAPTLTGATSAPHLPTSLYAAVAASLGDLDGEVLDALLVVAVSPSPTLALVESVLESADAWQLLEPARDRGLVEIDGVDVVFRHPLYRAAVLERASPRQRAEIHRCLAERAETRELRAHHLAGATDVPNEEIAAEIEAGAREALLRGAPETGADLAARSRELTSDADAARRRGLLEADCLQAAGDLEHARDLLTGMADAAPPGAARAELLLRLARMPGNFQESIALCERALVSAPAGIAAEIGIVLAIALFSTGDGDRATAQAASAIELATTAGDALLESRARALLATIEGVRGNGWDLDSLRYGAELEVATLEHPDPEGPSMWFAAALHFNDQPDEAREWTQVALERALRGGDALAAIQFRSHLATVEARAGRSAIAREMLVASIEEEEQIGWDEKLGESLELLALIDAWLGHEEGARSEAERGVSLTRAAADQVGEFRYRLALTVLELGLENWAAAAGHAEAGLESQGSLIADPNVSPLLAYAVEAHASAGDVARADELTRTLETAAQESSTPRLRMVSLRSRGLTQAAGGDLDDAVASLEAAVSAADDVGSPNETGRTRLMLGRAQRRLGRRAEARATLERAVELLEESGARLFADQARAELARVSGRRAGDPDELTGAERRIAELVAEGRSNKEVAAALFLSVKTVEVTLTRVYRKLGVRSRSELVRRMGAAKD